VNHETSSRLHLDGIRGYRRCDCHMVLLGRWSLEMIKYFHELSHEEFKWLCVEGNTWEEVAIDFPGPPWCQEQGNVVSNFGCWSLINFVNGRSMVTEEKWCIGCDLYNGEL
jgi:hypothetical protein